MADGGSEVLHIRRAELMAIGHAEFTLMALGMSHEPGW